MGFTEIMKILKRNMQNVLLALQNQTKKVLFLIKDIEMMKRNEKSQILSVIQETTNIHAVVFYNNTLVYTNWNLISISPPLFYDKMVHLCWICAEEKIDLELEEIEYFAGFKDLRNAINSMIFTKSNIQERDYIDLDDFSKILFANESVACDTLQKSMDFSDLLCHIDVSEFKPTRYWYTEVTAAYIDRNNFVYGHKQSFIARNAQMTHRMSCLQKACRILNISIEDLNQYSNLYKNMLLRHETPLNQKSVDYEQKAKSLYTIAKLKATPPQCKTMKKTLGIQ
tara:strand:- start:565 stop:1413 length:849 start_codon:yes stop_codon:yes gene_type:complete